MPTLRTHDIAARVGGRLVGPGDLPIDGAETLERAGPGHITFVGAAGYAAKWPASRAGAVLALEKLQLPATPGKAVIHVADADLAMAQVLDLLAPPPALPEPGVHPTAVVAASATLGANVRIGAHCTVGAHVRLGEDVVLHPQVTVLDHSVIGAGTVLYPGVVIRERCTVGARCIFHPNVVVGADGFGYRPAPGGQGLVKITHIGTVEIGDDVELGAGTCIDRGKFSATVIGGGSKIDNLCQIGHNCRLGRCVVLSGQVGLAGSVTVGDGVMMGGKVGVGDHLTIGAGARIMASGAVMDDVPAGQTWAGYPAREWRTTFRQVAAVQKLPQVMKMVEKMLGDGAAPTK